MLTLFSALLGFLGSVFPDFIKLWQDSRDKKHELAILQMQMEQQKQGHTARLEEINAMADIAEAKYLGGRIKADSGVRFIDGLNASVRPVLAYSFFGLYCAVKYSQVQNGLAWQLWTPEDQAIFAAIISFYFGQRAMSKVRKAYGAGG